MKPNILFLIVPVCLFSIGCDPAPVAKTPSKVPSAIVDTDLSSSSKPIIEPNTPADRSSANNNQPPANTAAGTASYKILSWNVESEGADADVICEQMSAMNTGDKYDVVALTEVLPADLKKFRLALGKHYKYIFSKSGYNDKMQLLYNESKFEKVRQVDLDEINVLKRYRAPMLIHLKDRTAGVEFMVMVNHLARGKAEVRQQQATMLMEWARDQTLPIFAVGDYNFDYVFETEKGNPAFTNFMKDNIWRWVKPSKFVDTNWYDNPKSPDGKDDFPGSMLDFAFVAGPAKDWKSTCTIIVREGDFPDDKKTSDHRPFELLISN